MRRKIIAVGLSIVLATTCFSPAQATVKDVPAKPVIIKEAPVASIPAPPPAEETVAYQTPLPEPPPTPEPVAVVVAAPVATPGSCGDNEFAAFIYGMESGGRVAGQCDTHAQNGSGCLGIGQACPASKLTAVCPNLDYACENAFFTDYALSRYGSWAGAYQFWVAHNWW